MMSILNNVTKQPPDHIKNTVGEIRLKIDAWIIPTGAVPNGCGCAMEAGSNGLVSPRPDMYISD
jgi:hypothetical protein